MKVLIVDDDVAIREILKIMLDGFDVIEASDGESAVKLYKKEKPDIVFMDVVLPKKDGIQATKEILKIDPNAKIVGITAFASKGEEMLKAGAIALLEKPITRRKILELIDKICGKQQLH